MKKSIFVKILSLVMVLCLGIGGAIPAFAMEASNESSQTTVTPRAGEETIPYGGTETYIGLMNDISTNVTPVKIAAPVPQTHRMILRVNFAKSELDFHGGEEEDDNGHPIRVDIYVIRSNGQEELITSNIPDNGNVSDKFYDYKVFRTNWFSVYPGERIQFKFDIVSDSNPTGHLRYADVQYWAYCD